MRRERKNKKNIGARALSVVLSLALFIGCMATTIVIEPEKVAKAADGAPTDLHLSTLGGTPIGASASDTYQLRDASLTMKISDDISKVQNKQWSWSIIGTGTNLATLTADTTDSPTLTPKAPGTVTVKCELKGTVKDDGGNDVAYSASGFGQIEIVFALKTTELKYFYKVYDDDDESSLVLKKGDSTTMQLTFAAQGEIEWHSDNSEVVQFVGATSEVKGIGAGKTTIYAHDKGSGYDTEKLNVYVVPEISKTEGGAPAKDIDITEEDPYLYVNADFTNKEETVYNKIQWEITRDINHIDTVVAHSNPNGTNELLRIGGTQYVTRFGHSQSQGNQFEMEALTGKYTLRLYVNDGKTLDKMEKATYKNDDTIFSNITIYVKGPVVDKTVTLGVGDVLSLAESYQMTVADFNSVFTPTVDDSDVMTNVSADATSTALKEGETKINLSVTTSGATYAQNTLGLNLKAGDVYHTTVSVINGLTLSEKSLTMWEGQTKELEASRIGSHIGMISKDVYWESSDKNFVDIIPNENNNTRATLDAKRDTGGKKITITAYFYDDGGIKRTATCTVIVEKAVKDFKLLPADDPLKLNLSDKEGKTITAEFTGTSNVTEAPLRWLSSDESIFKVETVAGSGNKLAIVKPVAGGTATLIVENTYSGVRIDKKIEVVIPIEKLELPEEMTFPEYQQGHNMMNELKITPANATAKDLEWTMKPAGLAEIDESGYMKFKAPGQFYLTVMPKVQKNPADIVYAKTLITITGGPDNITFPNLKDDNLDIEVSQTKEVEIKFEPATCDKTLIWKTDKAGIVLADYDEERSVVKITGRKVGNCTVTCRTGDNAYYSFTVNVTQASTGVSFSQDTVILYRGDVMKESYNLSTLIKMIPDTSTDKITYTSRDEKVAKVDKDTGIVTAVAAGQTYVMATTSSGRSNSIDVVVVDRVTGITSPFRTANVYIGETLTISPTVAPDTATNKSIKWDSEPYEVGGTGSVDLEEKGSDVDVTGVSEGLVMLTGISDDNASVSITYVLNVKYRKPQYKTKVVLTPATKYINVGKSFTVHKKVTNAYKGNKTLKWKSSNKKVATVSKKGKVKAKKVGKATITATCQDGSKAKGKMKVVVRRQVTKIKLNKTSASLLIGKSVKLKATVKPSNATVKGVKWKTSDKDIATVDGGKVIAVGVGMCKITATSKDTTKKKAYCWITVREPMPVTNFTVADSSIVVVKGNSVQSGITPNPVNATDSIKYWSDNKAVATVTSRGKIKTKKTGKATIYARASNGVEAHVDVTVVDLNRKAVTLRMYDTEQLSVIMISSRITWYSADKGIATVDANGLVTGRKPGTTVIYAKVDGVTLGCRVKVKKL